MQIAIVLRMAKKCRSKHKLLEVEGERAPVLHSWRRASYSRESRTLIPKRFLKTEVSPFRESYAHELIALAVKYTLIRQKTEKLHESVDK